MASASTSAFLEGQGIPVDPAAIESTLEDLWGPAAEQAGGPDLDQPSVTKVVLANVIVSALRPTSATRPASVLEEVVAHYPSRTIVLRRTEDSAREVKAEVSALCHLPAPGMPQVCSERIVLLAGPNALDLLPGAVRPLLESDLPCILWWTDSLRETAPLFRELAGEATRIILDRRDPIADPSFLTIPCKVERTRDSAWYGITPWRELLAQLFDAANQRDDLSRIRTIALDVATPSNERLPRTAAWLLGWLAGQLGWVDVDVAFDPKSGLSATFKGPNGPITATVRLLVDESLPNARIQNLLMTTDDGDGEGTIHIARVDDHPDEVRVEVCTATHCRLPRRVLVPVIDVARQVAAALEAGRYDGAYLNARPHVLFLLDVN